MARRLSSFCCCAPLQLGVKIMAMMGVIFFTICFIKDTVFLALDVINAILIVDACVMFLSVGTSVLLFLGASMERKLFLIPALLLDALYVMCNIILSVFFFSQNYDTIMGQSTQWVYFVCIFGLLIFFGIWWYCWFAILSYFLELKEMKKSLNQPALH